MKNYAISVLLVFSIALQSFFAVANSSENHQIDSQHIQVEHSHDTDSVELFGESTDDGHDIKDCHHCGHCQGSHTPWFTSENTHLKTPELLTFNHYLYTSHLDKHFIEELIRPPIA